MTDITRLSRFLAFSSDVTAFTAFDLEGTGQAEAYLATLTRIVGDAIADELLDAYDRVVRAAQSNPSAKPDLLRRIIFGDAKLGPIARNVIKLWFAGAWYELPKAWHETFGARDGDHEFMVSPDAYIESLIWTTIGAHPPGAKAPGYDSWSGPPEIPPIP